MRTIKHFQRNRNSHFRFE